MSRDGDHHSRKSDRHDKFRSEHDDDRRPSSHDHRSRRHRDSRDEDYSPVLSRSQHSRIHDDDRQPEIPDSLKERFQRLTSPDIQSLPLNDFAVDNVPLFEEFADDLISVHERAAKFFEDVRVGDRIAAQIRTTSAVMIEVELLCMSDRFRRVLEPLKLGRFKLMHDRTDFDYHAGDMVEVRVVKLDDPQQRLGFEIAVELAKNAHNKAGGFLQLTRKIIEAPLTTTQLPMYYRNWARRRRQTDGQPSPHSAPPSVPFADNPEVCRLAANPSAVHVYGFPRRLPESAIPSLHSRRPLRPPNETAESLRQEQHAQIAEMQIRRAGELIRNNQNFEAIQCCNSALQLQPENLDALLGRAIAANNMENFASAVQDLNRILKSSPTHARARGIIDKVLVQYAEKLEEQRDYEAAGKEYERALEFAPSNSEARTGLLRVRGGAGTSRNGNSLNSQFRNGANLSNTEVVDLTEDDEDNKADSKRRSDIKEDDDPIARKKRLAEFENFKSMLAKRLKR